MFPFHWCCFKLFLWATFGTNDPKSLDKDVLYNVMFDNVGHSSLKINYGSPSPQHGHIWEAIPGEEV